MGLINSLSATVYEPMIVVLLLFSAGLLFFFILLYCLLNLKFNMIGFVFLGLSIITYLLVGIYMVGKGYYYDTDPREGHIFNNYGFLELILLTYPYIFLTLACSIGKKKKQ
ncbi:MULTISPECIES: hypothetical protein [unclassified Niallia]|uniref:hypothetical protein n=1 Tax=Niallia TaxID=2837506 RepID=UPI001EDC390D|nr:MULTISPECIES: hypothetical protein [unclassified Niallia]MCM3029784.1 hypothetical protein [Niallia sp. MER 6]UPO87309.1 hypothetical protein L8T27_017385 [Niallia sp. Man26]